MRNIKRFLYTLTTCVVILSSFSTASASSIHTSSGSSSAGYTASELPAAPSVTAESAIIMEASTGLVLYEKNSTATKYPASITKILTTLLAIENSSLTDTVTFSNDAVFGVDLDSSRVGIDVGEQLSMEECLYAIMLASANEVSYAVAEHVGGTMENFVSMMNAKTKELGCVNSNFANPHGLQDTNHYTCAYDMALIAREAIKNTTFEQITGSRTFVIPPTNLQKESRPLANHHKFIKRDLRYDGVVGGKTGYTSAAKYTLVTYAKRGDMELICVVMASDSVNTEYSDTASLLDYGFNNFSIYNISNTDYDLLSSDSPLFTQYSTVFSKENAFLTSGVNGYVVLPNNVNLEEASKKITYESIESLREGDNVIGHIIYTYEDKTVGMTDIIYHNTSSSVLPTKINSLIDTAPNSNSSASGHLKLNGKTVLILTVIVFVSIAIGGYYLFIERPRRKRRKAYLKRRQAYRRK